MAKDPDEKMLDKSVSQTVGKTLQIKGLVALYIQDDAQRSELKRHSLISMVTKNWDRKTFLEAQCRTRALT